MFSVIETREGKKKGDPFGTIDESRMERIKRQHEMSTRQQHYGVRLIRAGQLGALEKLMAQERAFIGGISEPISDRVRAELMRQQVSSRSAVGGGAGQIMGVIARPLRIQTQRVTEQAQEEGRGFHGFKTALPPGRGTLRFSRDPRGNLIPIEDID